jgi:zona occludens toxin
MDKRYRVDVYFGPVTGVTPPISKREREIHGKFKKEIYRLYQSHTKSMTNQSGEEKRIDNRFRALGGLSIKIGFIAMMLALIATYFGIKHMLGYFGLSKDETATESLIRPEQIPYAKHILPVEKKPVFSFLSNAEKIFLTGEITIVKENHKSTEYNFEIEIDDTLLSLSHIDLAKLKYDVRILSRCMAVIHGPDFDGYALCRKREETKGWIEDMVVNPSGNDSI